MVHAGRGAPTGFRATVGWAPGASITAGDYQIFDNSQGGGLPGDRSGRVGTVRLVPRRQWGARPRRAAQQHFQLGFFQVDVPPAPDHTIRTTVKLYHGSTVRCMWHGFPRHVVCATDDKPVFEAVGGIRHWRIIGGCSMALPRHAELFPSVRSR